MPYRKISIIALVVAVVLTGTAGASNAENLHRRDTMLRHLNAARRNHGLPKFRLNRTLSTYAWRHSRHMARQHRIFHTVDLHRRVRSYNAATWGENVAVAGRIRQIVRLWLRSPSHRRNMLRRSFRRVGVGVARVNGRMWATAIFYG
jgi:uncharacterized protein YkwD